MPEEEDVPDIVFLDIRMPVLDGRQTLQRIRADERWKALKVVAISASTLAHQRQAVLDDGFDAFIGKPFRFGQVCMLLAEFAGATFVYADKPDAAPAEHWDGVQLSAELAEGLMEAAEFRQVTKLEKCFDEIASLDAETGALVAHLRDLRRQHRMDEIVALVRGLASNNR